MFRIRNFFFITIYNKYNDLIFNNLFTKDYIYVRVMRNYVT